MLLSDAINLRINELLKENNLTVYKLSYRAGISNSIISDCKRGKVKEPTLSSIIHICEGFGIELKGTFSILLILKMLKLLLGSIEMIIK